MKREFESRLEHNEGGLIMFHYIMAQSLAKRIFKLKEKLEKHMAKYYNHMLDKSHRVGKDCIGDDYYINRVIEL